MIKISDLRLTPEEIAEIAYLTIKDNPELKVASPEEQEKHIRNTLLTAQIQKFKDMGGCILHPDSDIEKVFADVAGLTPESHKNVLGNKYRYINALKDFKQVIPLSEMEG